MQSESNLFSDTRLFGVAVFCTGLGFIAGGCFAWQAYWGTALFLVLAVLAWATRLGIKT